MKDRPVSLSKKLARRRVFWYNEGEKAREQEGERVMEKWGQDKRGDVVLVDIDQLVPAEQMIQRHIWAEHLELAEELRKTRYGRILYALRKKSIERVLADAKEKHGMRYTNHRGLARVRQWVTLKFSCMNLKKLANWRWELPRFSHVFAFFFHFQYRNAVLV